MSEDEMRTSIQADMAEFRRQLGEGTLQRACTALLNYMSELRTHFRDGSLDLDVSGLYQGYLDMTYFALFPPALKRRDLKIAVVFNHETFGFEAWLAGRNREMSRQYWELFRDGQFAEGRVITPGPGVDAIVECDLVGDVDLSDKGKLTAKIEEATIAFIRGIEEHLASAEGESPG